MRRISFIMAAVMVSGCNEMADFYPEASLVTIDGVEYFVRERGDRGYHAGPNNPEMGDVLQHSGATYSAGNIAAIESVTNCRVAAQTIQHQEMHTFASVVC